MRLTEDPLPGVYPASQSAHAGGGSEGLRAEWVGRHAPAVLAVCLANVRNFHEAEDLMQETFTKALAGWDSLRDREKARPWLLQIARRVCIDHARQRRPAAELPADLPARPASNDSGRIERLHAALARLPDEYRETISLYYLDGRDCAGVAASLGISPGAVRTRLLRGRVMLYDLLKEDNT